LHERRHHTGRSTFAALVLRWIPLCAAAEFFGIAAAALWYGAVNVLIGEPEPLLARTGAWILMTLAAVPEGLVLGGLQAIGIGWFLAGISRRRWIAVTVAVGALGWGIGTFIPLFLVGQDIGSPPAEPGLLATALFSAAFGLAVGAIFGIAQFWALPPEARRKGLWILANAVGWGIGLPCIYVAAQLAGDLAGWAPRIALWALGGLGAGAALGTATGVALVGMRRPQGAA
jgi:hypothetical protein